MEFLWNYILRIAETLIGLDVRSLRRCAIKLTVLRVLYASRISPFLLFIPSGPVPPKKLVAVSRRSN